MNADGSFNRESDYPETSRVIVNNPKTSWAAPALAVGLVALAGFSFYQNSQVGDLRQELTAEKAQTATIQNQIAEQNTSLSGTVSELQSQLSTTQEKTSQTIAKVQDVAKRHADAVAGNLEKTLEQKNAERQEAVNAELAGVKNAAADTASQMSSKIDGVGASVDTVKTDLASTKAVVDKTATDLQRATGDMGLMSGLIATNGKEIQELRALGDRNIYEFTITKKAGLQKVGDVQIRLSKTDDKHGRYTIAVMSNDKLVEKKDKTTNEPVQFYSANGGRIPDEVVVNEVGKDTIKGYLATPKVATARK
jgi:chromosome segregation ATPase